jgi:DNA-binding NtrC family response regulator
LILATPEITTWIDVVPKPVVLIVEDEPLVRLVAAALLQDAGFETLEADTADDALHLLEEHEDVRVLFSDIQIPGDKDGLDLAIEVHGRWPEIGLVLTSGGVTLPHGAIPDEGRFLAKPYDHTRMVQTVREVA